jgi:hypothetical protein
VDIKLSLAFHPQTDGQTERVNQVLEQYLRCTINYQQDDWMEYLSLAEFAYNNTLHASTQQTPFFSNYGYHPKLDLLSPSMHSNPAAEGFAKQLSELQAMLRLQLQTAQESYKATADKFRNEAPTFKIGDKVWLLRRNIKTKRPCDKLDYRRLGPFFIQKKINLVAYRLELSATMKVHPVFHVSLLEPYRESTFPGRVQSPPPSVEIENHEEYEVDEILDSRRRWGKLEYLVHWSGYDINERSWEAAENLANAPEKVQEFHQ